MACFFFCFGIFSTMSCPLFYSVKLSSSFSVNLSACRRHYLIIFLSFSWVYRHMPLLPGNPLSVKMSFEFEVRDYDHGFPPHFFLYRRVSRWCGNWSIYFQFALKIEARMLILIRAEICPHSCSNCSWYGEVYYLSLRCTWEILSCHNMIGTFKKWSNVPFSLDEGWATSPV